MSVTFPGTKPTFSISRGSLYSFATSTVGGISPKRLAQKSDKWPGILSSVTLTGYFGLYRKYSSKISFSSSKMPIPNFVVVDTLPQFACLKGDSENNAGDALAAMHPLLRAAADGIGVILTRHERKSGGEVGDSGRGSTALAGAVDIVLSLRRPEGNANKTHRLLQALSRFS